MDEISNNHFKTHHVEDINQLLLMELESKASVCVVQTTPEKGRTGFLEEQGELIRKLWLAITAAIQNIYGIRTSWTEVVFFHPSLEMNSFQDKVVQVLKSTLDTKLKSKAIFSSLNGSIEERINTIESMQLQLSKLNYWEKHQYPSYWDNGKEIKLKIT